MIRLAFLRLIIRQSIKMTEQMRCPYCVMNGTFRAMTDVAEERRICTSCGHIAFLNDKAFRCPCHKCQEINFSPSLRRARPRRN